MSAGSSVRPGVSGLLLKTTHWIFLSDLGKRLKFPPEIVETRLRPDIVIYSHAIKVIIMVELTCPCEENFQVRNSDKLMRYTDLKVACEEKGWDTHLFAVEVGARGYTAQSLSSCLRALGLRNRPLRSCLNEAGDEALRTSFWLWILREKTSWEQWGRENES